MFDALKIASYAVAIAIGAWCSWQWQAARYASLQHNFDTYKIAAAEQRDLAIQAARLAEKRNTQRLQEALDAAERRDAKNLADAAAARRAAGGLREQLAAYRSSLHGVSADACRNRSGVLSDVLGDSVEAYRDMAEQADRIASDLRTMREAWPQ